jgi:nicotinamidase-related amidase
MTRPTIRGLEPDRQPALIISECQRGILDPVLTSLPALADHVTQHGVLARIAVLAAAFRELGHPVVHAHIAHLAGMVGCAVTSPLMSLSRRNGGLVEGTPASEPMPETAPQPGDIVSARRSGLAMWYGTDLDALLRNLGVDTLVMTGVSTNLALFGGSLGAVDRGYQVVIPVDCTAGGSPETHEFMITDSLPLLASMTTSDAVIDVLQPPSDDRNPT